MVLLIGLTGGICSGKSTISTYFSSLGAALLDADKLGHEAYQKDTACYLRLIEHFGTRILSNDGSIDRKVLGGVVFGDKREMEILQSIVWPEIRKLITEKVKEIRTDNPDSIIVVEAAILLEAKWQDLFESIIVVTGFYYVNK
jgi:dephospho-CoA kinase